LEQGISVSSSRQVCVTGFSGLHHQCLRMLKIDGTVEKEFMKKNFGKENEKNYIIK